MAKNEIRTERWQERHYKAWRGYPYTNDIISIEKAPPFKKLIFEQVMDKGDYEDSILINCSLTWEQLDFDPEDRVRVKVYQY